MNVHTPFQWSDEVVDRMKKMALDGQSGSFIARELGTTRSAVCGKLFRLNLKMSSAVQPKLAPEKKTKHAVHPGNIANKKASHASDPLFEAPKPSLNTKEYEADCLRLTLTQLGTLTCRYEIDNPAKGDEYRFCGKETDEGQSWCPHHRKLVFQPRTETLRAKAKAENIARKAA